MNERDAKPLILGLHRVGRPSPSCRYRSLFITPQLLDFSIRLLKAAGYTFRTLKEATLDPEPRTAVLTFDDGYLDNYTAAKPVLERHGIKATVFVVSSDVGRDEIVWDEADETTPAVLMTWEHLSELQAAGWEIGSHASEHVHLDERSFDEQMDCIDRSISDISARLGDPPSSFCYPYGAYNGDTQRALRSLGFANGLTSDFPGLGAEDVFELRRVNVWGRNIDHYFLMAYRLFKGMLAVKGIYGTRLNTGDISTGNAWRETLGEEELHAGHVQVS